MRSRRGSAREREYGTEKWITKNYQFKISRESELISYPLFFGNPTSKIKEVISNLVNSTIKNESFEKKVSDIKKSIPKNIGASYFIKEFFLNVMDPLLLWDNLPDDWRLIASGILLIVDVGTRTINHR